MEWDGINLREGLLVLEECYDQLVKVIKGDSGDPQKITVLVAEAEQIVDSLSFVIQSSGLENQDEVEMMKAIKIKADAIVNLLREEMDAIAELFKNITTGRQALNAYDIPPIGLGYTEGKFVDRKK
ncbi:MAG TPA: hypothetical protein DDW93_11375 [Firmicutes bacterium]|jgi:ElaB/YqjD/DUF883 family membrane-anchored ribosome-binding protein|nr:hypothetical protein [Bacillota bacterium]HBK67560.1 hypothetical protein [Bacillota bacterium]HBT18035.1 hypothetical protein [Bacillota bacterium]